VVAAGALLACLSAGAVGWNALAVQIRRHPAPLFAPKTGAPAPRSEAAAPPSRPPVAAAPSLPAPPPAKTPPPRDVPVETARPASAAPAAAPTRPASPRDPIGDVIRGELDAAAPKPDGARVTAAQKALLKLGYGPVKPDGVAGPATRQAIERFERERRLPVTGDLGPRTVRELSAQSGVPIE
jgi:hypothetical protein